MILQSVSVLYVFGFTTFAIIEPFKLPEWIQYGAFGLCCFMVLHLMWQMNNLVKAIVSKDEKFIELLKEDIESRNRLSELLSDRQCVARDHRIKQ